MKKFFNMFSMLFVSMIILSTNVFAESTSTVGPSVNPYIVLVVSTAIFIWEHLVAMNKNIKSNSTISLIISMAKQFLGIK